METNISVIQYNSADHEAIYADWSAKRKLNFLPFLLSENGFVVTDNNEPVLMCWVYFLSGVPIVQLDNLMSRPKTSAKKMRLYWARLLIVIKDFIKIKEELSGSRYFMLRAMVIERLADEAAKGGFKVDKQTGAMCKMLLHE